jgi:alpha-tubulin suppressor-like RCC1 family protein
MRRRVGSVALGAVVAVGAAVVATGGPAASASSAAAGSSAAGSAAADGGSIVYGWGNNFFGQAGYGTAGAAQASPLPAVALAPDVVQATGGDGFSVAVRADGTVWTWGSNESGQLGDGSTAPFRTAPGQVPGLPRIRQVAAAVQSVLAAGVDGSVWAWGYNRFGQLGDGTAQDQPRPVRVSISGVTQVAVGLTISVARRSDGTVWNWGIGVDHMTPVRASTPSRITQVAAGFDHAVALRSDGSVWSWGSNFLGQLGTGTPADSRVPVRVDRHVSGITQIAAGGYHSLALGRDRKIWAWGDDEFGQVGDGATSARFVPVHLAQPTGVTQIGAGPRHSLAVRSDRTLWAWGLNESGELGNGHAGGHNAVPGQIPGLTGVVWASMGTATVLARATPPPFAVVPDLTNDTSDEAAGALRAVGLVLGATNTEPDQRVCLHLNRVIRQSEVPGTVLPRGAAVSITIAVLPPDGCIRV